MYRGTMEDEEVSIGRSKGASICKCKILNLNMNVDRWEGTVPRQRIYHYRTFRTEESSHRDLSLNKLWWSQSI